MCCTVFIDIGLFIMEEQRVLPMFTVDSFSSMPFGGNPAAVCLDTTENGLPDDVMQKIGTEMNLPETAFVRLLSRDDSFNNSDKFSLRWFTPTKEVPLCGHATLASAAVLFFCRGNKNDKLEFVTRKSGSLFAKRVGGLLSLDLPLNPPSPVEDTRDIDDLIKAALGDIQPVDVQFAPEPMCKLLLRLPESLSREDLERMTPPIDSFMNIHKGRVTGVILTMRPLIQARDSQDRPYDFISRYFAPWNGIPEDPVTGSAHSVLASYWSKQLGKTELYARQCSDRGGDLLMTVDEEEGRFDLAGPATVVLTGSIRV